MNRMAEREKMAALGISEREYYLGCNEPVGEYFMGAPVVEDERGINVKYAVYHDDYGKLYYVPEELEERANAAGLTRAGTTYKMVRPAVGSEIQTVGFLPLIMAALPMVSGLLGGASGGSSSSGSSGGGGILSSIPILGSLFGGSKKPAGPPSPPANEWTLEQRFTQLASAMQAAGFKVPPQSDHGEGDIDTIRSSLASQLSAIGIQMPAKNASVENGTMYTRRLIGVVSSAAATKKSASLVGWGVGIGGIAVVGLGLYLIFRHKGDKGGKKKK